MFQKVGRTFCRRLKKTFGKVKDFDRNHQNVQEIDKTLSDFDKQLQEFQEIDKKKNVKNIHRDFKISMGVLDFSEIDVKSETPRPLAILAQAKLVQFNSNARQALTDTTNYYE